MALAGLVVNDQGYIGQDGTGLPPIEQTLALMMNLSNLVTDDYLVFRQAKGAQRKLNTLTQFSSGYPQSANSIAIRGGGSPRMVSGCQSLSELLRGKSVVSERGTPTVYRTFALKHDFSENVKDLMENPSLLQKDGHNPVIIYGRPESIASNGDGVPRTRNLSVSPPLYRPTPIVS